MPKYINADKAIATVQKRLAALDAGSSSYMYYSACMDVLRKATAEDVREDTHGQWIEDGRGYCHCSECGYEVNHPIRITTFCPGCGANMEPDPEEATAHNRDCKMVASGCKMSRHKEICDGIHALYERKNHDYGDSFGQSFRDHGILAGVIRIEDKFNRLKTLAGGAEQKGQDESIRDTLRDMANYAIMTLLEMEAGNEDGSTYEDRHRRSR